MLAGFMSQFRQPRGFWGGLVVRMMNRGHATMARQVIARLGLGPRDVVLDIGCGGGVAIRMMAEQAACVCGIDISEVSVARAEATNRRAVMEERVRVARTSVLDMPYADGSFTLATAFETVYFWDDIAACFARVYRALKPGGRFAIALESWKSSDGRHNLPRLFSSAKPNLYSAEELESLLREAGFESTGAMRPEGTRWLCVLGWKEFPRERTLDFPERPSYS